MDGNRELEQLDAEARALKATLMRYMTEALTEDQGLNKLTAELTRIVQASQRHTGESTARAEQKLQALGSSVETLRAELRTLVNQSHEQLLREVRALLSEQLGKRKKSAETDALAEQIERLQLEVRNLARGSGRAVAHDAPTSQPRRGAATRRGRFANLGTWRFAAPLAGLLALSVGYNLWQATRPNEVKLAVQPVPVPKPAAKQAPAAPPAQIAPSTPPLVTPAAAATPPAKQAVWDGIWKAVLELPLQQCWPEAKSNAKVSKFRDCACPKADKNTDKNPVCEWSAKWSAEASVAALQAVLSVAAAKPVTIDAKVGAGTFNAIDLLVRDCGFQEPALTQAIEELRTTRGRAVEGREPAAHQILAFMKKNLASCR